MRVIPIKEDREDRWVDEEETLVLPPGRRRRMWGFPAAALFALIVAAAGLFAGIRVEKGQLSSSASTARGFSLPTSGTARSGSRSGGSTAGFPAGGFAGGSASIGTVSSVDGNTIHLSGASGNRVKVKLSSATKITKNLTVPKSSLHPGDSVVIVGAKGPRGTVSAATVSDSGATNTGATATSTTTR